ncbi:choice-of-anchor Q domain-containing protein [Tahibacter caeni]|uniref:choice-of-anchor Q domain-containing protein n=1 Tax=Tahibacter caeni TaxID=1453545 RepID=UPI002147B478|nr:choice-of-anchor Q domain-containing protein [Tahibacter caeni]
MSISRSFASRRLPLRHPLVACLALALAAPLAAPAATLPVLNCDDSGSGSLRATIAAATSGDVVDLSGLGCSSIVLTSGALETGGAGELTVRGGAGQALSLSGNDQSRVFRHAAPGRLSLANLSLTRGRAPDQGGCVYADGALSLDNVTVGDCAAGSDSATNARGGGVYVGGDAQLAGARLHDNQVDGTGRVFGGGIAVGGVLRADASEFRDNHAHSHRVDGSNPLDNVTQGGGLHADLGLELNGAAVTGNTALSDSYEVYGGGVSAGSRANGAPIAGATLIDSVVSGNTNESHCDVCAPQGGGGSVVGDATLVRSTIADNVVTSTNHYGGGGGFRFFGNGARAELLDTTVSGNQADSAGGGLIGPGSGVLHVERSRIENNEAGNLAGLDEAGGGILGFGCAVELIASSVSGNVSGADGGGVNLLFGEYAPSPSRFVNSTISGNGAREGGGIFASGGDVEISNTTIAFNTATRRGAGFSADEYTYNIQLHSSIVANNQTGTSAANVWAFPETVSGADNLIPTGGGSPAEMPGDTVTADPQLLPLAGNGGGTLTHALAETSPAIDAGSNAAASVYDQRGAFYLRSYGAGVDIGAYEAQPLPDILFRDSFEP